MSNRGSMDGAGKHATCTTCPRACRLAPGRAGVCGARANVGGAIAPVNYGKVTSLALDPVEKKPLALWNPGSKVLSVGSFGCNLACPFCQNWQIARAGFAGASVRDGDCTSSDSGGKDASVYARAAHDGDCASSRFGGGFGSKVGTRACDVYGDGFGSQTCVQVRDMTGGAHAADTWFERRVDAPTGEARWIDVPTRETSPQELVDAALGARSAGNVGLAFTYNEPLVGWEFVRDAAQAAHEAGLSAVAVTNGMVTQAVLDEVLPYLDAVNIDLKGFSARFYALCASGGRSGAAADDEACRDGLPNDRALELGQAAFDAVRNTIEQAVAAPHCHVEVTTLVVPGSDFAELEQAARWLSGLDRAVAYHVTQYHPAYQWQGVRPLPNRDVRKVARTAAKYLDHVFTGNM